MKKSYIFAVLFIFAINISFSQQGWQQVTAPQAGYGLYGIYFVDVNTGVCSKFKTTNGGQNWYQPTNIGGGYSMMFPVSNSGYLTGNSIYKTTNLGENWISQTNPASGILYGVNFININTGYASGELAQIIKTTNGGTNWTLITSGIASAYYLHGIFFVDENTGFVTGFNTSDGGSIIAKTTNGGANWSIQNFPAGTIYTSISFVNSLTGIVIGQSAAKTTDGGNTWVSKPVSLTHIYNSMYFSSASTGYAAGYGGGIVKTTNAGESWYGLTSHVSSVLNSIYFINDNTGFACGNNGVVIKTTDGGGPPFGIQQISSEVPKSFSLSQNYPNPFNPSTKIRFLLPLSGGETEGVRLTVYDALGKEVLTLINTQLQPGTYETDWDASNYPSGVYFYRLTAGSYTETKRMALLK